MFTAATSAFSAASTSSPDLSTEDKDTDGLLGAAKVAIITGAASGIGLSLAHRLLTSGQYKLILADISPSGFELAATLAKQYDASPRPVFVQIDVGKWSDQVKLFRTAIEVGEGHIDILIANAGITDSEDLYQPAKLNKELDLESLLEPNLDTFSVDLNGVVYGIKLFTHFARISSSSSGSASKNLKKIIITSSMFGLYPLAAQPLYSAAKHAIVGLVRSMAPRLLAQENIALNTICPSFVATSFAPPGLIDALRRSQPAAVTEMGTVMRAFDRFLEDKRGTVTQAVSSDVASDSWAQMNNKNTEQKDLRVLSGVVCEVSGNKLYDRGPVEYSNPATRWLVEDPQRVWKRAYDHMAYESSIGSEKS